MEFLKRMFSEAQRGGLDELVESGTQQLLSGRFHAALEALEQAQRRSLEVGDARHELAILEGLSHCHFRLGQYLTALAYQHRLLEVARRRKELRVVGYTLNMIGATHNEQGNFQDALTFLQQALATLRPLEEHVGVGAALGNLGRTYRCMGQYGRSLEVQTESLALARKIQDIAGEAVALGELGICYVNVGNIPQAIIHSQQALELARELPTRQEQIPALSNLGKCYFIQNAPEKALACYQQALSIAREVKDPSREALLLGLIGEVLSEALGDHDRAIESYNLALELARKLKASHQQAEFLNNVGTCHLCRGETAIGISYLEQSLALKRELGLKQGISNHFNNLGVIHLEARNLEAAERYFREAIELQESLRGELSATPAHQVTFFETQVNTHRLLQWALVDRGRTEAALEVAERGRSRTFLEELLQRHAGEPHHQEQALPPDVAQAKALAKALNATLIIYSNILTADRTPRGTGVRRLGDIYIWVLRPSGRLEFRKAERRLLRELPYGQAPRPTASGGNDPSLREAKLSPEDLVPRQLDDRLHRFYQCLVKPIEDLLPTRPDEQVIFIPHEFLLQLPFAAFRNDAGQYLIERHPLLVAPSLHVLKQLQRPPRPSRGALVVGNPTMPVVALAPGEPPSQLPPLPGAEREALAIAALLGTEPLTGGRATKAEVLARLPACRRLHLATHGMVGETDLTTVPGALALAPSDGDSGLLTAEELLRLDLSADLAVLSACNTGNGRITGDGIIGLSRALLIAGVSNVVVSLWPVPDAATAHLMISFYENLERQPTKAEALRQAMLATARVHPHPHEWAAFLLMGNAT